MFSVGEYIVYGVEGVCRVEEAGKLKVAGLDKNRAYYRLRPYYHDGTIYTPVDGKAVMRPVLTREELERLLPRLPAPSAPRCFIFSKTFKAAAAGRRAARQPCGGRVLPRHFIRARLRCAPAPVQDAPCQAEQPDGQPPGRQLDRAAQLAHGRGDALRGVRLCAWTSTCAGAGLSARKAGRIRLSAARGALRYTQVLCRSSRRAGLRRPASAHAYAAQSPRDPYDRQPRRSP